MAIDLSTAGVSVNYAVETAVGTRPTTGYKKLTGIKTIPEMNPAPEVLDTTTLDATEYRTSTPGLKDLGGPLEFIANLTQEFMDQWDDLLTAYDTAVTDGKKIWFCVIIPGLTKAWYFTGQPSPLGLPGMDVSAVLETKAYITPDNALTKYEKPTVAAPANMALNSGSSKTKTEDIGV